ncbi:hypothetical protein LCGC14_1815560 [marine sediment metagenome]|uniref:Uncharacterized protein n=1 Tax=marine sediment metagenome TaxID=412755 RepID=A0A0F9GKL0_9ZZZZ
MSNVRIQLQPEVIAQMQSYAQRLMSLIQDPEPGILSWHDALNDIMVNIRNLWFGTSRDTLLEACKKMQAYNDALDRKRSDDDPWDIIMGYVDVAIADAETEKK